MSQTPIRTFDATDDDYSTGTKGPEAIKADIQALINAFAEHKQATDGDHRNQFYTKQEITDLVTGLQVGQLGADSVTNAMLGTDAKVGSLASLTTTAKSSVVAAVNEVKASVSAITVPGHIIPLITGPYYWVNQTSPVSVLNGSTHLTTEPASSNITEFYNNRFLWQSSLAAGKQVYLEAVLQGVNGATAYFALNGGTYGQISTTSQNANGVRVRSGALTIPDNTEIYPVLWNSVGAGAQAIVHSARLVII